MTRKFSLPKGWYRSTVTELVQTRLPPLLGPLTHETAWRYVYSIVMWPQTVEGQKYLHLVESNKLTNRAGQDLANRAADYLRTNLSAHESSDPFALVDQLGKAYKAERARQGHGPPQKRDPNVTGAAFETALQVIIGELCGVMPSRTPKLGTLQGFELAPTAYHSRPDLVLFGPRDFRLLISTKWTLRKERIGTYLHEAYFYKRRRPDLQVAFVVNEFNTNILRWLSQDPLADRVYHVNLDLLLALHDPFGDLPLSGAIPRDFLLHGGRKLEGYRRWLELSGRIFDLSDLFRDIERLRSAPEEVLDPDVSDEGDDV